MNRKIDFSNLKCAERLAFPHIPTRDLNCGMSGGEKAEKLKWKRKCHFKTRDKFHVNNSPWNTKASQDEVKFS
jgi:hypothetical protein